MKITCLQENLNFGLQTVGHLVNKNLNLPILNNVLLEVKDGNLKLATTNLEIGIRCNVRCKIEEPGIFTVESKLLSEYVNLLPNDQVSLELSKDDFLKINCLNHKTNIKGIAADDFPVIPEIEKNNPYKIDLVAFKKAVSQVLFAVSSSESRPEISGVLMSFNGQAKNNLTLVGTDSYRLSETNLQVAGSEEEKKVIVPAKTLQEVLRIIGNFKEQNAEDTNLEIYLSENQILFNIGGVELISRLIEGEYPDYKQIIPTERKTSVIIDRAELLKAVKTVALFSKTGIFDINLIFDPGRGLEIKANNAQVGESSTMLEVEYQGEVNETVLNFRYLLEGLNNIGKDLVEISLVDDNIPCTIKGKEDTGFLYIIMPIKQ